MPTVRLPQNPDLDQLRRQAKDLRRAVAAGDAQALAHVEEHLPGGNAATRFPLSSAQAVIARHHGFASWPRMVEHLQLVERLYRAPEQVPAAATAADEVLRLAPLTYGGDEPSRWAEARRLLVAHPELTATSLPLAALAADVAQVERFLLADPSLARAEGGPHRWEPLVYLAYARHDPDIALEAVLRVATLLLEAGADPNVGYLWHGLPTPFTALTGAFGHGEGGPVAQPPHPHSIELARLLLDAGADPNDGQALYNRQFDPRDDHLELLLPRGLGRGDGGPWRAKLGDEVDSPEQLVEGQLWWAVTHGFRHRVRLLAEHGVPLGRSDEDGHTVAEAAALSGDREMVALLRSLGAPEPALGGTAQVVAALLAADRDEVDRLEAALPGALAEAQLARPGLVVWAAARQRTDAVALLVELGFDVNALARGDVPSEQPWQTALHSAVERGDVDLARRLLELGADPTIEDARFDATPLGWAHHLDQPALVELLEPLERSPH